MAEFLSPYQMAKMLDGVIPANRIARPNFLQTWFSRVEYKTSETVNFDREFQSKNTVAMYVAPTVDAPIIRLQGYGTQECRFAYVKEGLTSPDWEEINQRAIGNDFGQVDVMANWAENIRKKLAITEFNFENLFELNASNVLLYGTHTAASALHPTVAYDFGRTVVTTDTDFQKGYVPAVDLTTLNSNGGVGKRAWGSTGGTAAPTPYQDLITACNTVRRRGNIGGVILSTDAWKALELDITTNYAKAYDLTLDVINRIQNFGAPIVEKFQDLNYRRALSLGDGSLVDIWTYDAIYHNRDTGTETKYIPDGYMLVLPSKDKGMKVYGRIMHPDAGYAALPRYINTWKEQKTGKQESEIHMNYIMAHTDINSVVSWRVK